MKRKYYKAVSLFTGAGIGDIGFRAAGFSFVVLSELENDRAQLAKLNFPEAQIIIDDIWNLVDSISNKATGVSSKEDQIFLLTCTAPCQGMSKSGQGTLLFNIRKGKRPKLDPRNRLILPALDIIKKVNPRFVVFENVCEMRNTMIENEDGQIKPILEIIRNRLKKDYIGESYDVEFADYGIPQRRKRLITVYTRVKNVIDNFKNGIPLIPKVTHSKNPNNGLLEWIPVRNILDKFPPLDSKSEKTASNPDIPFHRVPVLDSIKYEWIKHTPSGASAFDNQCINPKCRYKYNQTHGSRRNHEGINKANSDTPLYCEKCGGLLPRPFTMQKDGSKRIMSGYTSAYKRMDPKLPCPALTRNLSYPCSDHKMHPFENRVISLAEAFSIHTLNSYKYDWGPIKDSKSNIKKSASDTLIRLVLGESIPPKFTHLLGKHLINLSNNKVKDYGRQKQLVFS